MRNFVARSTPWGAIQTGDYFWYLTDIEKTAVLMHEWAHIRNRDALKRLRWIVTLRIFTNPQWVFERCREQEFAADFYVRECGLAHALRSFLIRFPQHASELHPSSKQRLEALNV